MEFNIIGVTDDTMETLLDFVDHDGDGEINYAEFARMLTADDVMAMKRARRVSSAPGAACRNRPSAEAPRGLWRGWAGRGARRTGSSRGCRA